MIDWTDFAWVLLVLVPVVLNIREIPHRLRTLRQGVRGVVWIPVALVALTIGAYIGYTLSRMFPVLQWGWLGANIVFGPVTDQSGNIAPGDGIFGVLLIGLLMITIIPALLLFNWGEESRMYRKNWKRVGIWAVVHLIMGIPIWAIIPIFSVGVVYKIVWDRYYNPVRYDLDPGEMITSEDMRAVPYVAHFGTNFVLISVVFVDFVI